MIQYIIRHTNRYISIILFTSIIIFVSCQTRIDDLYEQGFNLWKSKRYEEAILKYLEITKKYPNSSLAPFAQFQMGNIFYLNLKRYEEAVIEYQRLISRYPDSELCYKSQLNIAIIYDRYLGATAEAINEYHSLLKYNPKPEQYEQITISISDCYLKMNKIQRAIDILEDYINKEPTSILSRFRLATLYDSNNETEKVIEQYKKIISIAKNKDYKNQAKFWLALIYEEKKEVALALELYKDLFEEGYNLNIVQAKIEELEKE